VGTARNPDAGRPLPGAGRAQTAAALVVAAQTPVCSCVTTAATSGDAPAHAVRPA
jgi:hypothetical protein